MGNDRRHWQALWEAEVNTWKHLDQLEAGSLGAYLHVINIKLPSLDINKLLNILIHLVFPPKAIRVPLLPRGLTRAWYGAYSWASFGGLWIYQGFFAAGSRSIRQGFLQGAGGASLNFFAGGLQGPQGGRGKVITALHCVLLLLPTVLACFISTPMMTKRLQQNGDS